MPPLGGEAQAAVLLSALVHLRQAAVLAARSQL
jgi:hypothetical protein